VTGRSPARLLAPLALVATAVALIAVVASSGGGDPASSSAEPTATATATATPAKRRGGRARAREDGGGAYTVEPGDTPSSIAEKTGVDLDALLEANPEADPSALTPGQELTLP